MDPDKDFLAIYQQNLFQESAKDPYKTADVRRKNIALTYKSASKMFNNTAVCDILADMLPSYTDLVDDQNGINNYADAIEALTAGGGPRECLKWKSNLDAYSLEELLEPLPCGGITCRESEITKEHISELFKKKNDTEESLPHKSVQPNPKPPTPLFKSFVDVQNKKPIYKLPVDPISPQPGCSKNFYPKPAYPSTSKNVSPKISPSNSQEAKDKFNMFKTAKEELHVQNVKKYGKANVNEQQSLNYGGQKRSLGTRRGVQNKFIPPVLRDNNDGGTAALPKNTGGNFNDEMEELDERLKNIDARMVELIRSEIMDSGPPISWDDIAGLEFAKTAIKEAVVWPLLRPDIFTGLRRPPKGILLFGPPGTGKTLIGKCIASQSQSTFFSISASSLTSKWIGDGEKMVRAMFAVARCHQPAVIFIDEIDSLLSQRSDTEHESSRRIKTEFLVQLDGAGTAEEERILLVGATNRPQELDEAARRRFVKRLYIPLPEKTARLEIVKRLMNTERNDLSLNDIGEIAALSDGYSGADMKNLCSEASLGPIRSIDFNLIQDIQADQVRAVTMDDFKSALNRVRASVSPADLDQYIAWDKTYGSGGW